MREITITLNEDVIDWLNKRATAEKCTIADFAVFVLNAVSINSQLNEKEHEKETIIQEA